MNRNTVSLKIYDISLVGSIFFYRPLCYLPETCQCNECFLFSAVNIFPILHRLSISRCRATKEEIEALVSPRSAICGQKIYFSCPKRAIVNSKKKPWAAHIYAAPISFVSLMSVLRSELTASSRSYLLAQGCYLSSRLASRAVSHSSLTRFPSIKSNLRAPCRLHPLPRYFRMPSLRRTPEQVGYPPLPCYSWRDMFIKVCRVLTHGGRH
jgi:hypothetical protein